MVAMLVIKEGNKAGLLSFSIRFVNIEGNGVGANNCLAYEERQAGHSEELKGTHQKDASGMVKQIAVTKVPIYLISQK